MEEETNNKADLKEVVEKHNSDWNRHSLLVLQNLRDLKEDGKNLEKRVRKLEDRIMMVLGAFTLLSSIWAFYAAYQEVIHRLVGVFADNITE